MRTGSFDMLGRPGTRGRRGALAWLVWLAAAGLLATAARGAEAAPGARSGRDHGSTVSRDRGDPDGGDLDGGDPDLDAADAEATPSPAAARIAGPPVGEVLAQAYRAAGLHRSPGRGWVRRARLAGLLPSVAVRTGRNTSWQDADPDIDRGTSIEARASWRLDRLLFDGRELQVASLEAARRRERRQLAKDVIRAYYHWQRTAAAAAAQPRLTSRAEEAAAELDALTDGWFSRQLGRPRRGSPAKPR